MLRTVGDIRINVVDEGEGDAIVFIHANTFSWRNWIPQIDELANRYRCIALDLRGYGSSDRCGPFTVTQYARDVADLCVSLGITQTHVVGISLGGIVAQAIAIEYPPLVRGLVLANTTAGSDPSVAERIRRVAGIIRTEGLDHLLTANFSATFSSSFRNQQADQARALLRELGSTDPLTVAETSECLATYDHRDRLGDITSPTLVIHGELDGLMGRGNAEVLAREIPDAKLVVLPDAGHLSNLEAPGQFNDTIDEFFSALRAGTA
jgi:pimeloyl-ACP methyl ester carboxylesterase